MIGKTAVPSAADAIDAARAEAADYGLSNASFEVLDMSRLPTEPPFDAIHDQVDPTAVLDRIHAALVPGGVRFTLPSRTSGRRPR